MLPAFPFALDPSVLHPEAAYPAATTAANVATNEIVDGFSSKVAIVLMLQLLRIFSYCSMLL